MHAYIHVCMQKYLQRGSYAYKNIYKYASAIHKCIYSTHKYIHVIHKCMDAMHEFVHAMNKYIHIYTNTQVNRLAN